MKLQNTIKLLIKILEKSNINNLEVSSFWGLRKIKLSKNTKNSDNTLNSDSISLNNLEKEIDINSNNISNKNDLIQSSSSQMRTEKNIKNIEYITAPLVCTIYLSPSPDEDNFI